MLQAAFKKASEGKFCPKCKSKISHSYWKRHQQECVKNSTVAEVVELVEDDEVCVISQPVLKENHDVKSVAAEEIILLDSQEIPTSSSKNIEQKYKVKTPENDVKEAYKDPSEGLSLPEVYEKLMQKLGELISSNKYKGKFNSSQNMGKLSQESESKNNSSEGQPGKKESKTSRSNIYEEEWSNWSFAEEPDGDSNLPEISKKQKSGDDSYFEFPEEKLPADDERPDEVTTDRAEMEIMQSDPEHGVSYVVRFFWKILYRVLSKESGIEAEEFWNETLRFFYRLISMGDSEQHLFIRLCIRHRKWLTKEEISKYEKPETSIADIASNLIAADLVEDSLTCDSINLEEILQKCSRLDLQKLARTYRVDHRHKIGTIIFNILQTSTGNDVFGQPLYPSMLSNAKKIIGKCYRMKEYPLNVFNSVLTLYCPMTMDSSNLFDLNNNSGLASNLMFQLLQVEIRKVNFCGPMDELKVIQNFKTFEELSRYIAAKKIEASMAWAKRTAKYDEMCKIGQEIVGILRNMLTENPEKFVELTSLPQHLRKFTDIWVYVRCCFHTIEALERCRVFNEVVEIAEMLISNEILRPFFSDMRGFLYHRYALDLHFHLKDKEKALKVCMQGLTDLDVRDKDRLFLQDRAIKISPGFEPVVKIQDPVLHKIEGNILRKRLGDTRLHRFCIDNGGEKEFVSVEELCLRHFVQNEGFTGGVHAEGVVWHTIFGIICYDIIFDHDVEGVWCSPLQDHPLDMNTKHFYEVRKLKFEQRFNWVLDSDGVMFKQTLKSTFQEKYGKTNAQVDWSCFTSFDDLYGLISCLTREQLVMTMKRIAEDHRHNRSGFPDLTLWNPKTKKIAVVEVKGPYDSLSTKQRLWLDFFMSQGINASVCHVAATKDSMLKRKSND
ncbi:hypothetical protein FO519_000071 [Halicephalobus sp. NKZ332]|nr:hypothetical protein FO519_000071 [Halicephalobus sp. NKZ332]